MDSFLEETNGEACIEEGSEEHNKAQEFKNAGNEKFKANNFEGAIKDYKKGLLHEPENPDLHANMSAAYIHLYKFIEAEEHALFTIHLRPDFFKGYMRAAKAAHGKGITRLAIKRLGAGLEAVTDPNGLAEIVRLKRQYESYLTLPSNANRQMDINSDVEGESEDDMEITDSTYEDYEFPPSTENVNQEKASSSDTSEKTITPSELPIPTVSQTEEMLLGLERDVADADWCYLPPKGHKIKKELRKPPKELRINGTLTNEESSTKSCLEPTEQVQIKEISTEVKDCNNAKLNDEVPPVDFEVDQENLEEVKDCDNAAVNDKVPLVDHEVSLANQENLAELKDLLKSGSTALLSGNFRHAVECYKAAKERVGNRLSHYEIDDRQLHVIKYACCVALINMNGYNNIVSAIQELNSMTTFQQSIPAMYILISRAYCKLNRHKCALESLDKLLDVIENCPIFPTFTWPGTNETIFETTPSGIKKGMKELYRIAKTWPKPTAVCRFENCLKTSSHFVPSELIYTSDPDFNGYVRLMCEEKCYIDFHHSCWKSYKETLLTVGKVYDKDVLGQYCLTMDCVNSVHEPSIIVQIEIIDANGEVKSLNKLDQKVTVDSKNLKKRRGKEEDKTAKAKKPKEKTVRVPKIRDTVAEPVVVAEDNADNEEDPSAPTGCDSENLIDDEILLKAVLELRQERFGRNDWWDPSLKFFGRAEEAAKEGTNEFLSPLVEMPPAVKDAKDFIFSYYLPVLKEEGPLKMTDVEELWKKCSEGFCDMSVVLPDLQSISQTLLESLRFGQVEDYICLAEQVNQACETVKLEIYETLVYIMNNQEAEASGEAKAITSQAESCMNSDEESDSEGSNEASEDADGEGSDEDEGEIKNCTTKAKTSFTNDAIALMSALNPPSTATEPAVTPPASTSTAVPKEELASASPKPAATLNNSLLSLMDETLSLMSGFGSTVKSDGEPGTNNEHADKLNETFETACESSPDLYKSDTAAKESSNTVVNEEDIFCSDDHLSGSEIVSSNENEIEQGVQPDELQVNSTQVVEEGASSVDCSDQQTKETDLDNTIQKVLVTVDNAVQTDPMKRDDAPSYQIEQLQDKIKDLNIKLSASDKTKTKLIQDNNLKDSQAKQLQSVNVVLTARLNDQQTRINKLLSDHIKTEKDLHDKIEKYKMKDEESSAKAKNMSALYQKVMNESTELRKIADAQNKETKELAEKCNSLTAKLQERENMSISLESEWIEKVKVAQQSRLLTTRAHWDSLLTTLKKRCLEKISELQKWFRMFNTADMESLPSWTLIFDNIKAWNEVSKEILNKEAEFETLYNEAQTKIANGEVLGDLVLPTLPQEPCPLSFETITKEVMDKHKTNLEELEKKIVELTKIVGTKQLEIDKLKSDAGQQYMQMLSNIQMVNPYAQTPMTTAFGSLAMQYPYPHYGQLPVPTIPPPSADTTKVPAAPSPQHADVHKLLQESSKTATLLVKPPLTGQLPVAEESRASVNEAAAMLNNPLSFLSKPPPPVVTKPQASMPPPPVVFTQNVFKSNEPTIPPVVFTQNVMKSSEPTIDKKMTPSPTATQLEFGVPEKPVMPKAVPLHSSRESTPTPTPIPEKGKKKKKSKIEGKDATAELVRMSEAAGQSAAPTTWTDPSLLNNESEGEWNVVGMPKVKHSTLPTATVSDTKLKSKKLLLSKLQLRWPTKQVKELEEVVRVVREQNQGSLSGLPYHEIEARCELMLNRKVYQKSATLGLIKFSDAAWGTVKQPEIIAKANLQLEECIVCLELMDTDRTRLDCNHEFHTQCLRKWLKEKRVCPLCNKFAAMPDEFPAL